MVRETRQPAVRQPRHRNHRSPNPPRRAARNHSIGVDQNITPACQTSKVGEIGGTFLVVYSRVVAQWRAIVLLSILPCVVFLEARFDEFARFDLILLALLLIFIASQIFWLGRLIELGERFIPRRPRRVWLAIIAAWSIFVFLYSYSEGGHGHVTRPDDFLSHG